MLFVGDLNTNMLSFTDVCIQDSILFNNELLVYALLGQVCNLWGCLTAADGTIFIDLG